MTDFEIMQKMSSENKDIRLSTMFLAADKDKRGGRVTFGVDHNTFNDIAFNGDKYILAVYVINKEQFDNIKNSQK